MFSAQDFDASAVRRPVTFCLSMFNWRKLAVPRKGAEMQDVKIPCVRCGASLPITARFCSHCGAAIAQYFVGSTTPSPQSLAYGKSAAKSIARTRSLVGKVLVSLPWAVGWTFLVSIILVGLGEK